MTTLTKNILRQPLRLYMRMGYRAACKRFKTTDDGKDSDLSSTENFRGKNSPLHDQMQRGGEYSRTNIEMLSDQDDNIYLLKYGVTGFKLQSGVRIVGPIAVFPRSVMHWNVKDSDAINEESLSLFTLLYPKPDILILGVGDIGKKVHPEVFKYLSSKKINVEILPTDMACATFNFLNSEHRYVVAGLIPPTEMLSDFDRSFMSSDMTETDSPRLAEPPPIDDISREQKYIMGNIIPRSFGQKPTYEDPELAAWKEVQAKKDSEKKGKTDKG